MVLQFVCGRVRRCRIFLFLLTNENISEILNSGEINKGVVSCPVQLQDQQTGNTPGLGVNGETYLKSFISGGTSSFFMPCEVPEGVFHGFV